MKNYKLIIAAAIAVFVSVLNGIGQTNDFNYQGNLNISGQPANGSYDFEFRLYTAESGGTQVGATATRTGVTVTNGVFNVVLAFPLLGPASAFPGADRWLEIAVRQNGSGGGYQQLLPRTKINSSPYAITAANASNLGGVAASQYVTTTQGTASYIQNSTTQQPSSNFNISGTGSASILSAQTQYNIGPDRFITTTGDASNAIVGVNAGLSNTGNQNSFFGFGAGAVNSGGNNSFFGYQAGRFNTSASRNAFFGASAGRENTTGVDNSFFGFAAGSANTTGPGNSFFGQDAGGANVDGEFNSFFGWRSGDSNTSGRRNAFFGDNSGASVTTGSLNTMIGAGAGSSVTTGEYNTHVGSGAGGGSGNGSANVSVGHNSGISRSGTNNTFLGTGSGYALEVNTSNYVTLIGANTGSAANLQFATAIGGDATVSTNNTIALGRSGGEDTVRVPGKLVVINLGSAGAQSICRNLAGEISTCSSSAKYKTDLARFSSGIDLIRKLNPVSFNWKDGGMADLGLVAEDVAAIEPLLTTTNAKGEIEGVKYDRIGVVLVNAVKEQQSQIEAQNAEIRSLKARLAELEEIKAFICGSNPNASLCKEK